MFKRTIVTLIILISTIFMGCGGGGGSTDQDTIINDKNTTSSQQTDVSNIFEYEQDSETELTKQDYIDAGVTGVTDENIDKVNEAIAELGKTDVNSSENIQNIVDNIDKELLPEITLTLELFGEETVQMYIYTRFNDAGYLAKDTNGQPINVEVSGKVNTSRLGTYILTYTATDGEGNTITKDRTVVIVENPKLEVHFASTVTEFRYALEQASLNNKHDWIMLRGGVYLTTEDGLGTFDFNDAEPYTLIIKASNDEEVILDGGNTHRVLDFDNSDTGSIKLSGLSIRNGSKGGISSEEYLYLENCKVYNNLGGSGVSAKAGIYITNSEIFNNILVGDSSRDGGGVYSGGVTTIKKSKIYGNVLNNYGKGGGVYSKDVLKIFDSKVYANSTQKYSGDGGGIFVYVNVMHMENTEVYDNRVLNGDGGGVYVGGYNASTGVDIINSKIYGNYSSDKAGGIYVNQLRMYSSEVNDNNATHTGGIYVSYARIYDSNITGNISLGRSSSESEGGAIYITARNYTSSIISTTNISGNIVYNNGYFQYNREIYGVGIYVSSTATGLVVLNSVIANNKAIHKKGGVDYGTAIYMGGKSDNLILVNNTIINNSVEKSLGIESIIHARGMFYNNIIMENDSSIYFSDDSKVFNNYVDYTEFKNENIFTIIKKDNIIPRNNIVQYNTDFTLAQNSSLIDNGLTPSSLWFGDDYYDNMNFYNHILIQLQKDRLGYTRDGSVDIGAYEYQK